MNKRILKNIIILVVILFSVNIFLLFDSGKNTLNVINEVVSDITISTRTGINNIQEKFKSQDDLRVENSILLNNLDVVNRKNNILTSEKDSLINLLNELEASIKANEILKRNLDKLGTGDNYELIDGRVILRNISDWNNKATINLGANDGVKVGQLVIYDGVYFGVLEKVDAEYSEVKLATSENIKTNIPSMAYEDEKECNGIIESYDADKNEYIYSSFINEKELSVGTKIYTNGYQENTPKGVLIGTIKEIKKDDATLEIKYIVAPDAELINARFIQVITNG